jgi:aspartate kinase
MIVMKFGGTSTEDADAVENVSRIVKSRLSANPIVVISAIAQATNNLESAGRLAAEGKEGEARDLILRLLNRHYAIVDALVKDRQRHAELRKTLSLFLAELDQIIKGVAILRELTPRTLDHIYSFGERMSSLIMSYVFREHGIDAVWIDTKDFMVTDDAFSRAVPRMDEVGRKLETTARPLIAEGKVVVTQGFIGVTERGERTTMGRESSDFSAAVIGAALGVDDVQIWTDVDGVLTSDPRVVQHPRKVKVLTFAEAYELSFFGAKVLHPNTMLPALEKNIPIHVFNSRKPELSGTLISARPLDGGPVVKSVAFKKPVTLLVIHPHQRLGPFVFWEHAYSVFTGYGITPHLTVSSEYSMSFAIDSRGVRASVAHDLATVGNVEVHEGKGIVSVVGSNIRESRKVVNDVFCAIPEIRVDAISYGASRSSLSFVVDEDRVEDVVRRLHERFFDSVADGETFESLEYLRA